MFLFILRKYMSYMYIARKISNQKPVLCVAIFNFYLLNLLFSIISMNFS